MFFSVILSEEQRSEESLNKSLLETCSLVRILPLRSAQAQNDNSLIFGHRKNVIEERLVKKRFLLLPNAKRDSQAQL
ncbi:MAG: hypothetical protein CMH45_00760 [Muricauda sp.]|mgnify:CR=1 FL=1|nr:hypothetical protein [Allomuricauda sp.]|tara:strand:- start:238 stop:468 length:231 start_codon:yes stop_codon:yes gene_type:complete